MVQIQATSKFWATRLKESFCIQWYLHSYVCVNHNRMAMMSLDYTPPLFARKIYAVWLMFFVGNAALLEGTGFGEGHT